MMIRAAEPSEPGGPPVTLVNVHHACNISAIAGEAAAEVMAVVGDDDHEPNRLSAPGVASGDLRGILISLVTDFLRGD